MLCLNVSKKIAGFVAAHGDGWKARTGGCYIGDDDKTLTYAGHGGPAEIYICMCAGVLIDVVSVPSSECGILTVRSSIPWLHFLMEM